MPQGKRKQFLVRTWGGKFHMMSTMNLSHSNRFNTHGSKRLRGYQTESFLKILAPSTQSLKNTSSLGSKPAQVPVLGQAVRAFNDETPPWRTFWSYTPLSWMSVSKGPQCRSCDPRYCMALAISGTPYISLKTKCMFMHLNVFRGTRFPEVLIACLACTQSRKLITTQLHFVRMDLVAIRTVVAGR